MEQYSNLMDTSNRFKIRASSVKLFLFFALLAISIGGYAQKYKTHGQPDELGWTVVELKNRFGVIDSMGTVVIPIIYKSISVAGFTENILRVRKDEKWSIIDRQGNELCQAIYDIIRPFSGNVTRVRRNGKWGMIDTSGKEIQPCIFDEIKEFLWGFAEVRNGNKWGAINDKGKELLPPLYDEFLFDDGMAPLKSNDKTGFIDYDYNIIIPQIYDDCTYFSFGSVAVKQNGRWGYINREGKVLIPLTLNYDHHGPFSDGLIAVKRNKKWGFIDESNNVVVPINLNYDEVFGLSDGLARMRKGKKFGFIDRTGKVVIKPKYIAAADFQNGITIASKESTNGLLIAFIALTAVQAGLSSFNYHMTNYNLGGSSLELNKRVREFSQRQIEIQRRFENDMKRSGTGLGKVKMLGLIDKNGKELLPFNYSILNLERISDSKYLIVAYHKKGEIDMDEPVITYGLFDADKRGIAIKPEYAFFDMITFEEKKWVIAAKFQWKMGWTNAIVKYSKGIIDYSERVVIPLEHDIFDGSIFATHERILVGDILKHGYTKAFMGMALKGSERIIKEATYGVIDHSGKVIIPKMKCEGIELIDNTFVATTKKGEKKYFDLNGREIKK